MLVLSRKRDESVWIKIPDGRFIKVTNVDIRGDKTRFGFQAPSDIQVHREEVAFEKWPELREAVEAAKGATE